jgi:hypothetical protein
MPESTMPEAPRGAAVAALKARVIGTPLNPSSVQPRVAETVGAGKALRVASGGNGPRNLAAAPGRKEFA